MPQFRTTCHIAGDYSLKISDAYRHFDDSVCYAFYPIDLHIMNGIRQKFFEDNKIGEMRHYNNLREKSHYWTLVDAYNTIEDLDHPQLIRDGFHHNFGRVC